MNHVDKINGNVKHELDYSNVPGNQINSHELFTTHLLKHFNWTLSLPTNSKDFTKTICNA